MISSAKEFDKPALIDSDNSSVGEVDADHHNNHVRDMKMCLVRPEANVKERSGSYDEPYDNFDISCLCDVFHPFIESFCSGDQSVDATSQDCREYICGRRNTNKKKALILNRRQSAIKGRHKLDYISLDTVIPNTRLDLQKSTSDEFNTFFYDSDPMIKKSWSGINDSLSSIDDTISLDHSDRQPLAECHDYYHNGFLSLQSYRPNTNSDRDTRKYESTFGIMNELMNGRLRLRWHPFSSSGPCLGQPLFLKVRAWIEMGYRLKRAIIDPKFSWCSVKLITGERSPSTCDFQKPLSVDLMAINRIMAPDPIERKRFPFANLNKSFMICSIDKENREPILFEACSAAERDRIMYGLKLIVSQFVSRIMVGDSSVLTDYFLVANKNRRCSLIVNADQTNS